MKNIEIERVKAKLALIEALMEACPELLPIRFHIHNMDAVTNRPLLVFFKEQVEHRKVAALLGKDEWDYIAGSCDGRMHMVKTVNGVDIELHDAFTSEIAKPEIAADALDPAP